MDIYIFFGMIAIAIAFIALYFQDRTNMFFVIAAGIMFMLVALPLVGMDTINYPVCDYVITNTTVTDNVTVYGNTYLCNRASVQLDWKLQEAIGAFFLLIGFGLVLSVISTKQEE